MTYDPNTAIGQVRLLINDTNGADPVFDDGDLQAFLTLEGGNVKLAAAQALDVIADDEVLTAKVFSTDSGSANGAAVADSLRKRAEGLRKQVVDGVGGSDDDAVFELIPIVPDQPFWWLV